MNEKFNSQLLDAAATDALGAHTPAESAAYQQELASAGQEAQHLDRQLRNGLDRFGDRVGDIVQFEVEEDVKAEIGDLPDAVRPAGGEHHYP